MVDKSGNVVLLNGEPVMEPCSAAAFREVREMLKDHGIDEEATEGSSILKVAEAVRKFEDLEDSFLIPDTLKTSKESMV